MSETKTERDLILVDQCIAHWERVRDNPGNTDEAPDSDNCAFCDEYFDECSETVDSCVGCPIATTTGRLFCSGTPYPTASLRYQVWLSDKMQAEFKGTQPNEQLLIEWQQAAQTEIDFLCSIKESLNGN